MGTSSTASIVFPVRYVSAGLAIQTTSRELSPAGVAVRSLQAPEVGARVSMALYLPNARLPEVAVGRVSRTDSTGGFWADFVVLDPDARRRIEQLLHDEPLDRANRKRAFPRHPVELRVRFRTARDFVVEHATNLSRGGIFIRCTEPPDLEAQVEVHVELPDGEIVNTRGIVVHRSLGESGTSKGVGVQFVDAADRFRERIDRYMESL